MTDITSDAYWSISTNWEGIYWYYDDILVNWGTLCVDEPSQSNYLSYGGPFGAIEPLAPGSLTVTITLELGTAIPSPLQIVVFGAEAEPNGLGGWSYFSDSDEFGRPTQVLGIVEFDIGSATSGTFEATAELIYPAVTPGRQWSIWELRYAAGTYLDCFSYPQQLIFINSIVAGEGVETPCIVKPVKTTFSAGDAGVPGDPGDPGYPPYCVTLQPPSSSNYVVSAGGSSGTNCFYQFVPTFCDPNDPFSPTASNCDTNSLDADLTTGTFRKMCEPTGGGTTYGRVVGLDAAYLQPQVVCYPGREPRPPVPGVPPTPASISIEYDEGWNYGADIDVLGANFELSFQVPVGAGGVVVGLTELLGNAGYIYTKYDNAFYVTSNTYQVIESGVNKTPYTEYVSDDVFKIRRDAGTVSYLVNDVVVYESLVESLSQNVMASYVMYRGGDTLCGVTSATLPNNGVGDGVLPLLAGLAADKTYAAGIGALPLLTSESSGRMTESIYSVLPTVTGFATDRASYAAGYGELPSPMTSYSLSGFRISEITTAVGVLWSLQGWSYGQSGGIGSGDAELPMLATLAADYEYAYGDGDLHPMLGSARDFYRFDSYLAGTLPALEITDFHLSIDFQNYLVGDLTSPLEGNLYGGANLNGTLGRLEVMVLTGTVENIGRISGDLPALTGSLGALTGVTGEIEGQLPAQLSGNLYGGAYITGDLPILTGLLGADVGSVGQIHGDLPALEVDSLTATIGIAGTLEGDLPELEALWGYLDGEILAVEGEFLANTVTVSEYVAWVMNLAHRGVTTYSAFPFEFLIRWQGRHLLANAAGIYEFDGSGTQEGAIAASFKFPPNGFGTMQHKRPARAYLQGSLTGEIAVGVGADEGELYESHTSGHDGLDYWPVKLPRGVKGNHLEFEVSNVDGADFEIESVDLLVHLTGRKL